ncbi:hypothetical protein [Cytobacillus sp. IB215665]|uniref:hypothetical protein n=1 Tax=Cytobacillus sp. IB215665 TaxID=3097357 RepID=UPI002A166CC8|nr:hypothetical protein [Cytobacillus sp. IB215665]MDX8365853.1 hypothetical protein [Cytobacillus sp. IB215665]
MTNVIKKHNYIWFLLLISIILITNFTLYNLPSLEPIPDAAIIGSLLDFILVIPLLTYLFIIRKRFSIKYIGLVILLSYGVAYLIVPNNYFKEFPFVNYFVIFCEAIFVLLELYILFKIVSKMKIIIKDYKSNHSNSTYFQHNIKQTAEKHLPGNRIVQILLTDISMLYYAFFSWRKKFTNPSELRFTYHHKTSMIACNIMIIHAIVIESIGLHYFLHQWNEVVAYILLILNIYSVLFILAEIQATRLSPFLLTKQNLLLTVGFSKRIDIPLDKIKEFKHYDGPEQIPNKELNTLFDARAIDFIKEKPMFEILLNEPQQVKLLYGMKKNVSRIILNADHPQDFYDQLAHYLGNENSTKA